MPPSRKDLAAWATELSGESVTAQLKELSTGVVLCRILEAGRPGSIETRKLMTSTRSEADAVVNLKLFMAGLEKLDPTGSMAAQCEVENVAKGQPQATLRLMQLVYSFLNAGSDGNTDAVTGHGGVLAPVDGNMKAASRHGARKQMGKPTARKGKRPIGDDADEEAPPPTPNTLSNTTVMIDFATTLDPAIQAQQEAAKRRQEAVQALMEERDFYLNKLRMIEGAVMEASSRQEGCPTATRVLNILHCHEDELGALNPVIYCD
mmetsp:Transcript_6441/g.20110  ORF Transcript_6441/g.20110 Transcript_6441/m.20110 type:complete len:263 (+) Transcript_6441:132-920(+)|eukprot:scaffold180338_cov33-Tisochrysis_lutea.AAC.1